MKKIELKLKKQIFIIEVENVNKFESVKNIYKEYCNLICVGSELTEDTAKELSVKDEINGFNEEFVNGFAYLNHQKDVFEYNIKFSALESFISAIELCGYYWGENPIKKPEMNPKSKKEIWDDAYQFEGWQEAESKTFNPEKTLIFQIL